LRLQCNIRNNHNSINNSINNIHNINSSAKKNRNPFHPHRFR
jgi:hypothetical protein